MKLNICESIRELRRARGTTQEALAQALGVTAQAVSRWEVGATYPDMELIPSIANYFGVSIDRLFGYNEEREIRISEVLKKVDELNDESWRDDVNLDECIALLRRALAEFPGNEKIMNRLALLLKQAGWTRHHEWLHYGEDGHLRTDFDRHRKNPYWAEAIGLFEQLFTDATDQEIRYSAAGELVLLYRTVGENEHAKVIAEAMPSMALSRQILLATAADGAEKTACTAEACISLLHAFREQFVYALINNLDNFRTDMPVGKIQGLIGMFDFLFSDGNMGPQHAAVCDLYLYLSRLQWEYGYRDEAFESLDRALEHARCYDALTEADAYTAPIVRHAAMKLPAIRPGELARNLPGDWPMWMNPDYTQTEQEIKKDPRWEAWVRRTQE